MNIKQFHKFHLMFSTNYDILKSIFEFCSGTALVKLASMGSCPKNIVKTYLQSKVENMLVTFFDRGKLSIMGTIFNLLMNNLSDLILLFYEVLSGVNGAIIGLVAAKVILPGQENTWFPADLNIAVPQGRLLPMSCFFRNHGYELSDTSMDDCYSLADIISFSVYSNGGSMITISESAYPDLFLAVVLASLHMGAMNFITANNICCLYPTTTPYQKTYSFRDPMGLNEEEKGILQLCGFNLWSMFSTSQEPCGDLCPAALRQFRGLRRIGLFRWRGCGISNLGNISYSWSIGTKCSQNGCIAQDQANLIKVGSHL